MNSLYTRFTVLVSCMLMLACCHAFAATRTSVASGNWTNAATWTPAGVPASNDIVIISSGNTIIVDNTANAAQVMVNNGGLLSFSAGQKLTINGAFTVNGMVKMNGGDISFPVANAAFILGANGYFIWDPATNSALGATLFTNGTENFAATSTLVIKKWYNYTTLPLGNVVTGNFGNLEINTLSSGTILEWNQNNQFQTHKILGTLTIDQGWITLDKSGAISNTTIGSIVLKNINSYFTGFSGTAAPSFTLTTGSINNNGGTFFGVYDGKANITLNVTGDVTNIGNFKVITNDGLMGAGMSNGNATFTIGGTFSQSTGDTRLIYNLYTSTAGSYTATIGALNLTGGIFMGHYSCSSSGATSTLTVVNNCTINTTNSNDKFRCIGLTNISAYLNNMKSSFVVGKDLSISGHAAAEFTSSASSGAETDSIKGNATISSGINSFNYGSPTAAHEANIYIGGSFTVTGGTTYLSRIPGAVTADLGSLSITNGTLIVKGDIGAGTMNTGAFNQSGGKLYHHSNYAVPTTDAVAVNVNGAFTHAAGLISFDDCNSSTAVHALNIKGASYTLSGAGIITTSAKTLGALSFARQGAIQFNRSNASHSIQQVVQSVKNGCIVNVTGSFQVASTDQSGVNMLTIENGATLNMGKGQIFSNGVLSLSAIQVDAGAVLKTACAQGLYNGSTTACISSAGSMQFTLDANSIVEYCGSGSQILTGLGAGIATTANQKYGVLRINMTDGNASPSLSNVYIRTRLELAAGEFNLNGHEVTLENGQPSAVSRTSGYIKSETRASLNPSILTWKNMTAGTHEFPFGVSASGYIPLKFTPTSGMGGNVSVSTRATSTDNAPLPSLGNASIAAELMTADYASSQVIDRWWNITAPGFTADVTLSYLGAENTMNDSCASGKLTVNQWSGNYWSQAPTATRGVTSGIGTVTVNNTSIFSSWMITAQMPPPVTVDPMGEGSTEPSADDLIITSMGPNPFSSQITLNFDLYQTDPVLITITNQAGILVYKETYNGTAGANTYVVQGLGSLNVGIYFLNMTYHGTTTTRKIVRN